MKNFIKALKSGKGFAYFVDSRNVGKLTNEQLAVIARELIYSIENVGLQQSDIDKIYNRTEEIITRWENL